MDSVGLRIRYRPLRVGWCVRNHNIDDLRRAMRLSHVFRGGIFNPIIPIGRSEASGMIHKFRVDALMNVSNDEDSKNFVASFDFLPWPIDHDALFAETFGRWTPTLLDVSHTLDAMADDHRNKVQYDPREGVTPEQEADFALIRCEEDDPLKDVLLATFGAYPEPAEIHRDYDGFIQSNLLPFCYKARKDQAIPASLLDKETPASITGHNLTWDRVPGGATIGFHVGYGQPLACALKFWCISSQAGAAMTCPEYDRLRQQYQTALMHSERVMLSPGTKRESISKWHTAQIRQKAKADWEAAHEQISIHKRTA